MKTKTRIDGAGRLVIPKELRNRYALTAGTEVEILPLPDGISIVPLRAERRVVKRGRVVAIDTGSGVADADVFQVARLRSEHLEKKEGTTA